MIKTKLPTSTITGLLTRNCSLDLDLSDVKHTRKKHFDAIAASSIAASSDFLSCNNKVITIATLKKFLETRQMELLSDEDVKAIIQVNFISFHALQRRHLYAFHK